MTTKEQLSLLAPSIFFLLIGILAFGLSNEFVRDHQTQVQLHEQRQRIESLKLDRFAANITNGTWQLTTEQWIERMRLSQATIQAEKNLQLDQSKVTMNTAKLIRILGWAALAGFIFQIVAVYSLKRNSQRQAKTETN